ncbi:MAG: zinc chelation protein SecC [Cyanobacteria bacterium REEB67]|nr:zinc chelation protein SecC [Cyanobacteria bacterium REEB67]
MVVKKIDRFSPCPCDSQIAYHKCCRPYHLGEAAPTPLALMRSRYCAYALGLVDYVIKTTDPANKSYTKDTAAWRLDLMPFCQQTSFDGLKIVEAEEGSDTVTFTACLRHSQADASFSERSTFRRSADGRWLYLSGTTPADD